MVIGDVGYERSPDGVRKLAKVQELILLANTRGLRFIGSAVLSVVWVASGRASAVYYGMHKKDQPKPWDWCAAHAIAVPAGATFVQTSAAGGTKPFDIYDGEMVCAATPALAETLRTIVLEARMTCGEQVVHNRA